MRTSRDNIVSFSPLSSPEEYSDILANLYIPSHQNSKPEACHYRNATRHPTEETNKVAQATDTFLFSFQIAVILQNRKTKTNQKVMKEKANRRHYEKSSPVTHIQTVRDHTLMAEGRGVHVQHRDITGPPDWSQQHSCPLCLNCSLPYYT
ncbi:hypothetical protein CDAR_466061 [Caerostris darwini]|uniref:Uncharacterized protein n=1 Tax=Caerostris darwini TaxID=1538125 RepID=A0AAV4WQE4_9ARAC|nr:hypothetical protein CDAR_466061 [Caerostris darwini]